MTIHEARQLLDQLDARGIKTRLWYCGPTGEWYVDAYKSPPVPFTLHPSELERVGRLSAWGRVDKLPQTTAVV